MNKFLKKSNKTKLSNELAIRFIKIIDIGFITIIYFLVGYIISYNLDNLSFGFDCKYQSASYLDWENIYRIPEFTTFGMQLSYKFHKENILTIRFTNLHKSIHFPLLKIIAPVYLEVLV
jgi:hypothetical protein